MVIPQFLNKGDKVALISPSGYIDAQIVNDATSKLQQWGLQVVIGKYAINCQKGRFAASDSERLHDIQQAINDNDIKAIICNRGGYGLVRIIDKIDFSNLKTNPKWILGFSDITALHNALSAEGIASIHCQMAKNIAYNQDNEESVLRLKNLLFGSVEKYELTTNKFNKLGEAKGKLVGGNLSLIYALRATPYDIDFNGSILFIEEICEQPYHIDRIMRNLKLSGALSKISGLIVGQFTDCPDDTSFENGIEGIILEAVKDYNYPVVFDFKAGHTQTNMPLIIGAETEIEINSLTSTLKQIC